MSEAPFDDLDLTSPEDRAIYRQRVSEEFEHMKFSVLAEQANQMTGRPKMGRRGIANRNDAYRVIAAARIMKQTGVWYG